MTWIRNLGSSFQGVAIFKSVLLFLLGVFVADCYAQDGERSYAEQKALYEAHQSMEKDDLGQAISILQSFIKEHDQGVSATTYLLLGNCWFEQNKSIKARKAYELGLQVEPDNTVLLLNFAISSYATGQYSLAGESFQRLYQLSNDADPEYLYRAGGAFFQAKDYAAARNVLKRLLAIQGNTVEPEWIELLIHSSVRLKDWQTAKNSLYTLLKVTPRSEHYWKLLAQVFLQEGSYSQAASVLEIAYSLYQPSSSEWKDLAGMYVYLNVPLKAVKALDRAYGQNRSSQEWVRLSRLYARAFRFEKAIDCLDQAIRIDSRASLFLKKGRLCYQAGMYAKAITALRKALDLAPNLGEAFILLGYSAWQAKDWDLAKSSFAEATHFTEYSQQAKDSLNYLDSILRAQGDGKNIHSVNS